VDPAVESRLATVLGARLREARDELTRRWLERISERVALEPVRVFPSEDLLDHMPLLIDGIAEFVAEPSLPIGIDSAVVDRARELGALRHAQGFDEYEILKEFEIFGGVLFAFLTRTVDEIDERCPPAELAACCQRVFQAVAVIQQASAVQFHQLMRSRVTEREQRLRLFNRALSHELRNQLGAAMGAGELLGMPEVSNEKRVALADIAVRNLTGMRTVLDNLVELTRVGERDARHHRHVRLREAAAEATRELRDAAQAASVDVYIDPELPDVEVNAAAVELCLTNLVSNAIKYADPAKEHRNVTISGHMVAPDDQPGQVVIEVHDNGLGVPEADRSRLFERLFRARSAQSARIRGTGMGLSIVRETVEALGGHVWASFPDDGSMFAFALPCRRKTDQGDRTLESKTALGAASRELEPTTDSQ
jgi:signal transduction histidine kinase